VNDDEPPEPVWLDPFVERLLATGPAATIAAAVASLEAGRPDLALPVLETLAAEVRVALAISYEQGRWAVIGARREKGIDYHATIRREP
jgi:hypothetical protein